MKRFLSVVIIGALAISMCAGLSGCGNKDDKSNSSVTSTIKATKPTKPATTTPSTADSAKKTDTSSQSGKVLVDTANAKPQANYKNEAGAALVEYALSESGYPEDEGYYGQIIGSHTTANGSYFAVYIFDTAANGFQAMVWVSEDGTEVIDADTFYTTILSPSAGEGATVPATYYIDKNITPKSDSDSSKSDGDTSKSSSNSQTKKTTDNDDDDDHGDDGADDDAGDENEDEDE